MGDPCWALVVRSTTGTAGLTSHLVNPPSNTPNNNSPLTQQRASGGRVLKSAHTSISSGTTPAIYTERALTPPTSSPAWEIPLTCRVAKTTATSSWRYFRTFSWE